MGWGGVGWGGVGWGGVGGGSFKAFKSTIICLFVVEIYFYWGNMYVY